MRSSATSGSIRSIMICPHGYDVGDETWCAMNFDNNCDYEEDPEDCRYNQEGITKEKA